ncbi:hypothetical protein GDO78_009364 [Eleutherodactylus coqui]|uniref:Uncharacterized protein n=1 Tax=Eleutherodactylus coqui TaxID=57060 RepID=A0A8J6K7A0_ELECQ|nr:hypothetical protein GDO78_009364 [Eleutherodactylus coqui]
MPAYLHRLSSMTSSLSKTPFYAQSFTKTAFPCLPVIQTALPSIQTSPPPHRLLPLCTDFFLYLCSLDCSLSLTQCSLSQTKCKLFLILHSTQIAPYAPLQYLPWSISGSSTPMALLFILSLHRSNRYRVQYRKGKEVCVATIKLHSSLYDLAKKFMLALTDH